MGVGKALVICLMLAGCNATRSWAQSAAVPLSSAHAHNDYEHDRPLLDALDRGFCSVEADIYLVKGELLVGHDFRDLKPGRTLQKLYLDPLRERVRQGGGRVYPGGPVFQLLIDFKMAGEDTYRELRGVLAEYDEMLCGMRDGGFDERAIQIVISGDRPKEAILADPSRRVGIDGRLSDLGSELADHDLPLISDRWSSHFQWRGDGEMPLAEQGRLKEIVRRAHEAGRRVRFWATPEKEAVWQVLLDSGVDHLNTDQLDRLRKFLLSAQETESPKA
ncbi:MAG: phosphatidylinositol-specific phospholipase C/glycerophosphodiester phosphodiesterase family protein [Planctomycetota bacterium]